MSSKGLSSVLAEREFKEAERLRAKWDAQSFRIALEKYNNARLAWRVANSHRQEVTALNASAEINWILGNYRAAIVSYNQALRLSRQVQDTPGRIRALNGLGRVHVDMGQASKALTYCKQAQSLSRTVADPRGEAQSLNTTGLVLYISSKLKKAVDLLDQALAIWQELNDKIGQAEALIFMGYAYGNMGEIQRALSCYEKSLSLSIEADAPLARAYALTAIGGVYSVLGEKQKALAHHDEAVRVFRTIGEPRGEAAALNGVGFTYEDLGAPRRALNFYKRAFGLYRKLNNSTAVGVTMGYLGRIYQELGNKAKALEYFYQKMALSRRLNNPRMEAYTLKDIGSVFDSSGDLERALRNYKQALALSQQAMDRWGEAYLLNSIGAVCRSQGKLHESLVYFNKALPLIRNARDRRGETITLYNIARSERDLGNINESREKIEAAIEIAESLRTKVASEGLRASYYASFHQYYELYIDLLMQMHKQSPSLGYDSLALNTSERARARTLLELLYRSGINIRQGVEPQLLERERALQQKLRFKVEQQVYMLASNGDPGKTTALGKEIETLLAQCDEVNAQLKAVSPRYAALTQPSPISLREIQQQVLDPDTVLLEYSLGEERSHLWLVAEDFIEGYELPARSIIEDAARRFYEVLTAGYLRKRGEPYKESEELKQAELAYPHAAALLSRMVFGPAVAKLGTKRLLIVADGPLQYVPFSALPDPSELSIGGGRAQPLIAAHEVITLPSASALFALRNEICGRQIPPKTVAVIADPVFEPGDVRVRMTKAKAKGEREPVSQSDSPAATRDVRKWSMTVAGLNEWAPLRRLPFASLEAASILGLIPEGEGLKAIGFNANRATIMDKTLQDYRILHIATHGLLNNDHPELSGVVLSLVGQDGRRQDGFISLGDIYNMSLPIELVVLSACQTAIGKEIKGEGLISLTRGFMYAGASRVVASLWNVDDRASAELMKYFYEGMFGRQRLRPAAALREAQIRMWKGKRWQSPYYWAAFVLQGEYN
jgi:CHAT domain-containing protein/tetratricopeptide (TPR) repeat protein